MPKKIPYSTDPNDLFNPGQAEDFFDPEYGQAPSDAAVCAEMARLAYLRHEDPGGRSKLETILRDRARFEPGPCFNTKGTQGFVAARSSAGGDGLLVVAFRGTEPGESIDLRQDSRFWPTPWGAGARVHTGFAEAFDLVREQFLSTIKSVPGRLLLTGHSLGAALATLAASLVPADRRAQTLLCTFGSPRVGDETFGASLGGLTHLRYAGARDLVTWVPPIAPFIPYRHHGILRCIDPAGAIHEFRANEAAHVRAGSLRGQGHSQASSLLATFLALVAREVPAKELTDHAPINYTSAVWGLR